MSIPHYHVIMAGEDECAAAGAVACQQTGKSYNPLFKTAILLPSPAPHVGGISASTLGSADIGKTGVLSGLYREEFAVRCGIHYGEKTTYKFGCNVGEDVYFRMLADLADGGVDVWFGCLIDGVSRTGTACTQIQTVDGRVFSADLWIDGGRFGDLMTRNVPPVTGWRIGTEAGTDFDEDFVGFMSNPQRVNQDPTPWIGTYVRTMPAIATGAANPGVQCWGVRWLLSDQLAAKLPVDNIKPPDYGSGDIYTFYDYRYPIDTDFNSGGCELGTYQTNDDLFLINPDTGIPYHHEYPLASYERRAELESIIINHAKGKLWYLARDSRRRGKYQDQLGEYGPALYQFTDTGNVPRIPYMRDGLRLVGEETMAQIDTTTNNTKANSVYCLLYARDRHFKQLLTDPANPLGMIYEGAGDAASRFINVNGAGVPMGCFLPKAAHWTNGLVAYCLSVTDDVWGSARIITATVMAGEVAGRWAALCSVMGILPHALDPEILRTELKLWGMVVDPLAGGDDPDPPDPDPEA